MLALELLTWWYSRGWLELAHRSAKFVSDLYNYFSVNLLLRTIFAPWKRIISYGSQSLNEKLRSLGDNLVSRMVGLGVRLVVLITAVILLFLSLVISVVAVLVWPLVPIAIPVLFTRMVLLP